MRSNFSASLKAVLEDEGGFSNHPNDAGGKTMRGVTQARYNGYRREMGLPPRHVRHITWSEVDTIYRRYYWDRIEGDSLPLGIDYLTFDAAVNSGHVRAAGWLQKAINKVAGRKVLNVDKDIGTATVSASKDYPANAIIDTYLELRLGFMRIARNSKTGRRLWPSFGRGWMNRLFGYLPAGKKIRQADGVDDIAKAMAAKAHDSPRQFQPEPVGESEKINPFTVAIIVITIIGVLLWQSLKN